MLRYDEKYVWIKALRCPDTVPAPEKQLPYTLELHQRDSVRRLWFVPDSR